MPLSQDALTQDELDYLVYATLSEKVANKDDVIPLDRIDLPTYNYLMRKSKSKAGDPVRGGYRFNVKGQRGQRLTWWDGMDILPFEERYTGNAMRFYVGKCHFGDVMPFDFLERTGVRVDYDKGIRAGGRSADAMERVVNVIKENADDIKYNYQLEMAKHIFKSNFDQPKAFIGLDGLLPVTNPTFGTIGGMSRTNPRFQHRVSTGWTADTIQFNFSNFVTLCQRRSNGRKIDYIAVGDTAYEMLQSVFTGTSTVAGKFDYRSARDLAMSKGEKIKVGLPQDCFMYEDIMIVREPLFEELHSEDPTAGWLNRIYFLNSEHLFIVPVMKETPITHPVPYNQRVQYTSWHSELTMACVMPNSMGVATVTGSGSGLFG